MGKQGAKIRSVNVGQVDNRWSLRRHRWSAFPGDWSRYVCKQIYGWLENSPRQHYLESHWFKKISYLGLLTSVSRTRKLGRWFFFSFLSMKHFTEPCPRWRNMVGFDTLKPSIALLVFRQLIIWVSASSLNVVFFSACGIS